jgi:integrase
MHGKNVRRAVDLASGVDSPYVFINTEARPILQDKLREHWARCMKKSGLRPRRMYETRHTFASWALAAGETPAWVAHTLDHVDTSMVHRIYGRFIPNLTRQDGSGVRRTATNRAAWIRVVFIVRLRSFVLQ